MVEIDSMLPNCHSQLGIFNKLYGRLLQIHRILISPSHFLDSRRPFPLLWLHHSLSLRLLKLEILLQILRSNDILRIKLMHESIVSHQRSILILG